MRHLFIMIVIINACTFAQQTFATERNYHFDGSISHDVVQLPCPLNERNWYWAHKPSAEVPGGFNHEVAIKDIVSI